MKVLTVRNPWAYLFFADNSERKDVENRTWSTAYRGELLIHTSQKQDSLPEYAQKIIENSGIVIPEMCLGAIIGKVTLVEIIENSLSPWAEPGCKHWVLRDPVLYATPITGVKGKLGLWEYMK